MKPDVVNAFVNGTWQIFPALNFLIIKQSLLLNAFPALFYN